jgi:hypothetical protein
MSSLERNLQSPQRSLSKEVKTDENPDNDENTETDENRESEKSLKIDRRSSGQQFQE